MKTAILLGATGLTGGKLLQLLLSDGRYDQIKLFSRSSAGFKHPKIREYLGDLMDLERFKKDFTGDEVFCCIGTTASQTPDKDKYRSIDYGIPVEAATIAKHRGIETFIVISSLGANAKSNTFYTRIKGEMEQSVLQIGIAKTCILRPSLIGGERDERRLGEWLFKKAMKVLDFILLGPLKKYRSIKPNTIANCMVWLANNESDQHLFESDEIEEIGKK